LRGSRVGKRCGFNHDSCEQGNCCPGRQLHGLLGQVDHVLRIDLFSFHFPQALGRYGARLVVDITGVGFSVANMFRCVSTERFTGF
jgi:hypothetical protein